MVDLSGTLTLPATWKTVRLFDISSTFRDMQEERGILVKSVFPQLCKLCEERGSLARTNQS